MTRWIAGLVLAACGNTSPKVPHNRVDSRGPEPGVFMTPRDEHGFDDTAENPLYVSVWRDGQRSVVGLLCRGPCLPNVKKAYSSDSQSYRSESLRELGAGIWEAQMHLAGTLGEVKTGADFTMRLDLSGSPHVEFDGRKIPLVRLSFQEASYHLMGPGQNDAMLFSNGAEADEFLIKVKQPEDGKHFDESFLYLTGASKVQTVRSRNWHYQLAASVNNDEAGSYFAVLHGDIALPEGDAAIDVDVLRTPASDVAFWLTRPNKPKVRFLQSNDSNTRRFEACTADKCHVLIVGERDGTTSCRDHGGRIVITIDPAGSWRAYHEANNNQLLDRACKVAYTYEYVDEFKVILKDPSGAAVDYTRKPETWEKP